MPKHASWLNMVEIEIGVLRGQCLDRRIATQQQLKSEIAVWERQRNAAKARIKWMFTTDKARARMGRAYPKPAVASAPRQRSQNLCDEVLEEMAAQLLKTARNLPPWPVRHDILKAIGKFRVRIAALKAKGK